MNRLSFTFLAGVILALVVGGMAGYASISKSAASETIKKYDMQIENLTNDLKASKGESLTAALSAKKVLDGLKVDYIKWSGVIEKILATTPKDAQSKAPIVEYTSYSGSQNSDLSISVKTISGSKTPYSDVANLIRAFSASSYFQNPFVPSISTSADKDSNVVLVFNFNVDFAAK